MKTIVPILVLLVFVDCLEGQPVYVMQDEKNVTIECNLISFEKKCCQNDASSCHQSIFTRKMMPANVRTIWKPKICKEDKSTCVVSSPFKSNFTCRRNGPDLDLFAQFYFEVIHKNYIEPSLDNSIQRNPVVNVTVAHNQKQLQLECYIKSKFLSDIIWRDHKGVVLSVTKKDNKTTCDELREDLTVARLIVTSPFAEHYTCFAYNNKNFVERDIMQINIVVTRNVCQLAVLEHVKLCKPFASCVNHSDGYQCRIKGEQFEGGHVKGACKKLKANRKDVAKYIVCPTFNRTRWEEEMRNASVRRKVDMLDSLKKEMEVDDDDRKALDQTIDIIDTMNDNLNIYRQMNKSEVKETTLRMVDLIDFLMTEAPMTFSTYSYSRRRREESATDLVLGLEAPAMELARRVSTKDEPIKVVKEKLELMIHSLDPTAKGPIVFRPSTPDNATDLSMEEISLELKDKQKGDLAVVFTRFKGLSDSIVGRNISSNLSVISNVISAALTVKRDVLVTFRLNHIQNLSAESKRQCGFWNQSDEGDGWKWSYQGCIVLNDSGPDYTRCQCDHLTNFAVLLDHTGGTRKMSEKHVLALNVITYAGCIVAIISLFLFLYFILFVGIFCLDQFNLALCLMLGYLFFAIGIARTENEIVCSVMAGLIHYFFLAAFTWKLIFGINTLRLILSTRSISDLLVKWRLRLLAIGYGVPAVIVGITAGLRHQDYGNKDYCWLSLSNGAVWAFAGPVSLVLLVNAVGLCIVAVVLVKNYFANLKNKVDKSRHLMVLAQLTLTMGLTWLFGVLMLEQTTTLVFSYLFAICTALQALLLFLLVAVVNEDNRHTLKSHLIARFSSTSEDSHTGKAIGFRHRSSNLSTTPMLKSSRRGTSPANSDSSDRRRTRLTNLSNSGEDKKAPIAQFDTTLGPEPDSVDEQIPGTLQNEPVLDEEEGSQYVPLLNAQMSVIVEQEEEEAGTPLLDSSNPKSDEDVSVAFIKPADRPYLESDF